MYYSIKGTVTHTFKDSIVLEVGNISYLIFVSNAFNYIIGEEYLLYIYLHKREDDEYLVGFLSLDEKKVFRMLISVTGIGPKTALMILSGCSPDELLESIRVGDITCLQKIKGVTNKLAYQIILELRGKIEIEKSKEESNKHAKLKLALKGLGFKNKEIESALSKLDLLKLSDEDAMKEALRSLKK